MRILFLATVLLQIQCSPPAGASASVAAPKSRSRPLPSAENERAAAAVVATPEAADASLAADAGASSAADAGSASPTVDAGRGFFDMYAWVRARGLDPASERLMPSGRCRPVTVGEPPRAALMCEGGVPIHQTRGGESVFPLTVLDVHHGHLRELLRAPLYAGALDFNTVYVRLVATLSSDGRRITVAERPGHTCAMARASAKRRFSAPEDAQGLRDWLAAINGACRGVRRYLWRAGRFVPVR